MPAVFQNLGMTELVIILVLALILFGPGKLPDVGKAIGRGLREFRSATRSAGEDEVDEVRPAKLEGADTKKDESAS